MKSRFVIYIPSETREETAVSFNKVAGVPLFLRPVLSLINSGEKVFTLVAPGSHRRQVLKNWQRFVKDKEIHINIIFTEHACRLKQEDIEKLKEYTESSFYFVSGNYVFADPLATPASITKNQIVLYKPITRRLAMVGVQSEVLDLVKDVDGKQTVEKVLEVLISKLSHHYIGTNEQGIIVLKFSDIDLAEHLLAEHIRKRTQTFIAREINKRISLPISLRLARLRISPNTITVLNMFIGLCAGIGAASKTYMGVLIGALLFQTASILDGCDGEVAKLTFRASKFGQYIDSISDNLSLAAFLTGMMIHQRRISGSTDAYFWGMALIVGAACIILIMTEYLKKHTNSASFVTFDKEYLQKLSPENTPRWALLLIKYFKFFFKKDSFSMLFLVFAFFGILHWWSYMLTIGVWVGVFTLLFLRIRGVKQ